MLGIEATGSSSFDCSPGAGEWSNTAGPGDSSSPGGDCHGRTLGVSGDLGIAGDIGDGSLVFGTDPWMSAAIKSSTRSSTVIGRCGLSAMVNRSVRETKRSIGPLDGKAIGAGSGLVLEDRRRAFGAAAGLGPEEAEGTGPSRLGILRDETGYKS